MPRGRKPKEQAVVPVVVDHAKLLKQFEQEQRVQLETLYKDLAKVKQQIDLALNQIGFMDEAENLSQAAFRAGRAYGPLDQANDKLEEVLENIYNNTDLDHYDDIIDN
jgi:hypothetical protein